MVQTLAAKSLAPDGEGLRLGELATQLARRMDQDSPRQDPVSWALLAKVLNFAAEAEQQLSEQQRRIAELEALSTTDELTGLANRRGLDEFLKKTLAAARRHNEEGVLVFIDLDDFKTINDGYGHDAGDAALKTVADFLSAEVRASDLVARIGGDEFVTVLARCPAAFAAERTGKLETALSRLRVRHGRRIIPVSASCGHAILSPDNSISEILERADRMMYEIKGGKNTRLTGT